MTDYDVLKPAFDALATGGVIGDPQGAPAYAYIRVSSADQAVDGRSGLPRQIEHIHAAAMKHHYAITWAHVFADDHSGFRFKDRPGLTALREAYGRPTRQAKAIVMEHLDRLSRNADWHQGFLLDEMRQHGLTVIFWKQFNSRVERAVMGAIAQDGMEQSFERMRQGTLKKARNGYITAKIAAFGYKFVDEQGREGTREARTHTCYALDDDQAVVMQFMYEAIAYRGMSSYELLKEVDERAKTDPRFIAPRGRAWNERTFVKMLRNPLYKGEFIANRYYKERVTTTDAHGNPKTVMKERQRPEEEWIRVAVPPIVDEEIWDLANRNLYRNKGFARRNKKYAYLLTDLIVCATCGRRYHGHTENTRKKIQRYTCSTMHQRPAVRAQHPCGQRTIRCDLLDPAIWHVITDYLLNPDLIAQAIDERYNNDHVTDIRKQIAFLERQIPAKDTEEHKLKQAYLAGAYSAEEFAEERQRLVNERETLCNELIRLRGQILTPEQIARKKAATMQMVSEAYQSVNLDEAPFALKRQIVRLLVDRVVINVEEQWFELEGTVGRGVFSLEQEASVVGMPGL